jgi:predicted PurR-regulated permease PerM/CheY-like chemotaxis protein
MLQRRRLGRTTSVLVVVILAFSILGAIGWLVAVEVSSLANDIWRYESNLQRKLTDLRQAGKGDFLDRLQMTFRKVSRETEKQDPTAEEAKEKPTRVIVETDRSAGGILQLLPTVEPIIGPLFTAGVVILLVIYMLIKREDLRNRLIQLAGTGQVTLTTRAIDEAGRRISSYLLIKSLTNGGFGIALGIGLFLIGVPYAALWAFLTAILRFIPSLGTWVAAICPAALSLVVFESWAPFLLVIGLFAVLEVVTANAIEPKLYGSRIGVSPVALFVALIFWTWLWGPAGLVLATPLTVCLAVLGKHVPQLEFLGILLSDQPALDPDIGYYQRLLAKDQDEAADIATEKLRSSSLEQVFDELFIPALIYAKRDRENGRLGEDDAQFVVEATREIVEELALAEEKVAQIKKLAGLEEAAPERPKVTLVVCPARDETDDTAISMFRHLLDPATYTTEFSTSAQLASEVVALVEEKRPAIICIAALPPGGLAHTRLLCKRLRTRFPDVKIVVGRWGLTANVDKNSNQLLAAGADQVGTMLRETQSQVGQLMPYIRLQPQASSTPAEKP